MPKRKAETPVFTPLRSRRQASKEALKQMQILLDDEEEDESETFEIPSDDEDDVSLSVRIKPEPQHHPPPKKKYKLSHRKSSDGNDRDVLVLKSISNHVNTENTLELDCWVEELSEVQLELKKKYDDECKVLEKKIEELVKSSNVTTVHTTELSSAYEIVEPPPPVPVTAPAPSNIILQPPSKNSAYQLVMDPRLGLMLTGAIPTSVMTTTTTQPPPLTTPSKPTSTYKGKVQISQAVKAVANAPTENYDSPPVRQTRTRTRTSRVSPVPLPTPPPPTRSSGQSLLKNSPALTKTPVSATKTPVSVTKTPVTVTKTPITVTKAPITVAKTTPVAKQPTPTNAPVTRLRSAPSNSSPTTTPIASAASRPAEANVEGGLVAGTSKRSAMYDLTEETRGQADSREIAFNKLQGKTYPSLVVVARPHMRVRDLNSDRPKLDTKVKSVLLHPPTKFTEWLLQQGLVRSEQKCSIHTTSQLKLGMYSDVSKFPYSGGYVWISECCPQRFVSVFSGSLFEGSPHPPIVVLKLLYHWACQTNIQNVTQWVKVDNLYVKGMFTWLRAACTVAIHTHIKQLGGLGSKIEVGVISLGTTSQDGNQRQVKVEVLGILETSTKFIRLRAVEPDTDKNYKKRFSKILEPVMHWVHPSSTIITDLTVDKSTLVSMGFNNVVQSTSNEYGTSNRMIMEYLRQVVPRMFQNTLSLLSRQIIQQFLDELVWREWFGTTSSQAFDNIIVHLAEQTRADLGLSLITRLNRVAVNPFKSWTLNNANNLPVLKINTSTTGTNNTNTPATSTADNNSAKRYTRVRKPLPPQSPSSHEDSPPPTKQVRSVSPDVPEQMVPLENYYYGTIEHPKQNFERVTLNMKCPFCKLSLSNNIGLMHHLFKHAHNVSGDTRLCRYCLTGVPNNTDLMNHIATSHPSETKFDNGFVCLVCETQFMNPFVLGKHMSREHCPYELPYQCGSCSYRCSNHKQAIDHFYQAHSNGPAIQCPFCLKSTMLMSGGRYLPQNMNYFIQHLQKHQKKQIAKRCGKCNLWFIQKDLLKEHQTKMHVSQRGKPRLVPWTAPRNCVMVPKSKIDEVPDDELINYSSLHFSVTKNLVCKECDMCLDSPKHLSSFESCTTNNCQYSTCCATAMKKHIANCKVLNETLPKEPLPYIMFCICGFSSNDGNVLAKHLAICEKKSAYPSRASANKAVVNQSMLDVLGLVRKPEESQAAEEKTEKPSKPETRTKGDEDKEKVVEVNKKSGKETAVISLDDDIEMPDAKPSRSQKRLLTKKFKEAPKEKSKGKSSNKEEKVEEISKENEEKQDENAKISSKEKKVEKISKETKEKEDKGAKLSSKSTKGENTDPQGSSVDKTDDTSEETESKSDSKKADENVITETEEIASETEKDDGEVASNGKEKEESIDTEDKSNKKKTGQEITSEVKEPEKDIDLTKQADVHRETDAHKETDVHKKADEQEETDVTEEADEQAETDVNEETNVDKEAYKQAETDVNEEADEQTETDVNEETDVDKEADEQAETDVDKEADKQAETDVNEEADEQTETDVNKEADEQVATDVNEEADEQADTDVNEDDNEQEGTDVNEDADEQEENDIQKETDVKEDADEREESDVHKEASDVHKEASDVHKEPSIHEEADLNEESSDLVEEADEEKADEDVDMKEDDTSSAVDQESSEPAENGIDENSEDAKEAVESTEDNTDSVVAQSVLDTLAAECANTAKISLLGDQEMDVDGYDNTNYNLVESETPMDAD